APAPVPPTITTTSLGSGVVGEAFTSVTLTATGDTPITWTAAGLPAGLSLTGGTISGTPTASGTVTVTVTATNAAGSDTETFTLVIAPAVTHEVLVYLTQPENTPAEAGNRFNATGGYFMDVSHLTVWDNNIQQIIGAVADPIATPRTPIVWNNSETYLAPHNDTTRNRGWRSVGPADIDYDITVDTASAWQLRFETTGFENIRFSAQQKSTGSGPNSFALAYSLNGPMGPFTMIPGSVAQPLRASDNTFEVFENPDSHTYIEFVLPDTVADRGAVYLRIFGYNFSLNNDENLREDLLADRRNGNTSINHIVVIGDAVDADIFVPVREIINVPTTVIVDTDLTLTGTVAPGTATNQDIVWSIHDPSGTGATLAGTTLHATTPGTVIVRATITDGTEVGIPFTQDFPITVTPVPAPPTITTATLPDGTIDVSYTATLEATGGDPITWEVATGTLPDGLTLAENGTISGTPTEEGTFTFTVRATNDAGYSATQELTIVIAPAPEQPTIITTALLGGTVSRVYNATLAATGDTPITWEVTAGNLPGGLTLNTDTGAITGTPTTEGTFTFTVRATNDVGHDEQELMIVVATIVPEVLVLLTQPVNIEAEAGNRFNATGGYFMDVSHLTAWDNNVQRTIGSMGTQERTPIVFNNGATERGWQSVGDTVGGTDITVDTATAWQLRFETTGFENIRFSTQQKSTGSGPNEFALAYSLNGPNGPFIMIPDSVAQPLRASDNSFEVFENPLTRTYVEFALPDTVANQGAVYLRIFGHNFTMEDRLNGNTSINHIVVIGDAIDTSEFRPVTSIIGVPTTATVGTDLALAGTAVPSTATNRTIVWSVYNAGTTGATISGTTLRTTAPGTVVVRATIINGLTETSNFTQNFVITVTVPIDRAALEEAIAEAEHMLAELDYTLTASQAAVLAAARTALTAPDQLVVDTATESLLDVLDAVRRAALEDAIEQAEERDEAIYTPETWAAFAEALAEAQRVLAQADPAAARDAITEARIALEEAMAALTEPVVREFHPAYMFGNAAGEFMPRTSITRAQVAAILARTMIEDFEAGTLPEDMDSFDVFSDVSETNWFYHYVAWAYTEGLVQGDERGRFLPTAPITREQLAAMLARTVEYAEEAGEMAFVDVGQISRWADNYVYTVFSEGWMVGDDQNRFRPGASITRAEVATAVNRILDRVDSRAALNAVDIENEDYIRDFPDVLETDWFFPSVLGAANYHYLTRGRDGAINWKYIYTPQEMLPE
ncbi:MAG: putative Ig domain-containing protein, partial [Oscillospiraceae bacterium]|nr:putative Ig domain-containing protein [Oscillospiraceae bacterium]